METVVWNQWFETAIHNIPAWFHGWACYVPGSRTTVLDPPDWTPVWSPSLGLTPCWLCHVRPCCSNVFLSKLVSLQLGLQPSVGNHLLEPLCIVALTGCVCQSDSGLWTLHCMRWKLSPGKSTPLSRLASSLSNQSLTGCGFPQGTLRHRGYTWSVDASDGCQSSWWLTWEVSLTMLLVACSRLL